VQPQLYGRRTLSRSFEHWKQEHKVKIRLAAKECFRKCDVACASLSETKLQYLRIQVSHSYLILFDDQDEDLLERIDRMRK
jgi:hypothetical protein